MKPFSLLIKPSGPDCNLDCKYCFYSHKSSLFGKSTHRMGDDVLDRLIKDYLSLNFPVSSFAWQGGEPTLMGLDFYKKVVELQKEYGQDGQAVSNALQTNGVLLDEEWCRFLCEYQFLVGISLDGPKDYHDFYRLDHAGNGTFDKVMVAIKTCRRHKVEFNILVLLNNKNVIAPDELFDFFTGLKIKYLQFVPCVEKDMKTGQIADYSITPQQYGEFLCRIFDRWNEYGPEKLSIRIIDSMLNYLVHGRHTNCTFNRKCEDYIVIEHNGDAFCCDFFVDQQHNLGNIIDSPIKELVRNDKKLRFASLKNKIHNKCLICRHDRLCNGGCLKDRIMTSDGFANPSYFCQGYKTFFDHAVGKLSQFAAEIASNNRF